MRRRQASLLVVFIQIAATGFHWIPRRENGHKFLIKDDKFMSNSSVDYRRMCVGVAESHFRVRKLLYAAHQETTEWMSPDRNWLQIQGLISFRNGGIIININVIAYYTNLGSLQLQPHRRADTRGGYRQAFRLHIFMISGWTGLAQGESPASSPWSWTQNGNLNWNFSRSETDILFFNYVNYVKNIYNIDKIKSTNNNDNNGMISRKRNDYCFPSWSALASSQPISPSQTRPSGRPSAGQPV